MVNRECATPPLVQVRHTMWLSFTKPSPTLVLQATNAGARRPGYVATITPHTHTQTCEKSEESLRQQKIAAKTSSRAGQQPAWCSGYRTQYTPCCGWTWPHQVSDCACVVMWWWWRMGRRGDTCSSSINNRSSHSYCTQQTALIHVANSVLLSCKETDLSSIFRQVQYVSNGRVCLCLKHLKTAISFVNWLGEFWLPCSHISCCDAAIETNACNVKHKGLM